MVKRDSTLNTGLIAHQLTDYLHSRRKLRVVNPISWDNHRGGWGYVVNLVTENLHVDDGVRFVSAVDDELFYYGSIMEPWVGFVHQVPYQSLRFPDLSRMLLSRPWKESYKYCLGLWVLSEYNRRYLVDRDIGIPVAKVLYPAMPPKKLFSFDRFLQNKRKKLLFIGEFLRRYQPFFDLEAPGYEKVLFRHKYLDTHFKREFVDVNSLVRIADRVTDSAYDQLLAENLVFLNLHDAGANTTVIECIARGTPILINNVGGVPEYLGKNYPLFYSNLGEAKAKLTDLKLIGEAAEYLKRPELTDRLTAQEFLTSFQNTSIYRELPVPPSQQTQFASYDVSLIMCAYKRTYNLQKQLSLLCRQKFGGTFEVILWNNNTENVDEVNRICSAFKDKLNIKIIHSSENFYCIIRMAATSLMRSDLLLICDDDVLPQKDYIRTFLEKYEKYGANSVICARGHLFSSHKFDEDHPETFWQNAKSMKFLDEKVRDTRVHFLHADNALIPKEIMKKILQFEMPCYEFALVDDYWFSFVLSHYLKIPVWKIKADHILKLTECSDNKDIAMFHNSLVNEQRINLYIYHMRQGWNPSQFD